MAKATPVIDPPGASAADSKADAPDGAGAAESAVDAANASILPVEVRVLAACAYGQPNDVAVVPAGELAAAQADGLVDASPAAVAYAKSISAQ